jgi:fluoroquinolone transport system ATP-binding protein
MISVTNVSHDYEGKGKYAVENISFTVDSGHIFGFLGPSGAGKSTVQNIMTGLLPLQSGGVMYDDRSIKDLKTSFFNSIGVSFELPNFYPSLTGYENLHYFSSVFKTPVMDAMELLEKVGLRDAAHKRVSQYSKGMKQRLSFARSIINNPRYLFLDEPTSGLDPKTAVIIKDLIMEQKKRGAAVILTTHNMELADSLCDTVAFIYGGKLNAVDTPEALKRLYGKKELRVVFSDGGSEKEQVFALDDVSSIASCISSAQIIKMHTQEASLEQIFLLLTGKELSA